MDCGIGRAYVSEHQAPVQFRATCERRRSPRGSDTIRAKISGFGKPSDEFLSKDLRLIEEALKRQKWI